MTLRLREIPLTLDEEEALLPSKIAAILQIPLRDIESWTIVRKGIDARRKPNVLRIYTVDFNAVDTASIIEKNKQNPCLVTVTPPAPQALIRVAQSPKVLVVGMGPAGLFAALRLAESGARVTLVERGKPVTERLQDVQNFWQHQLFNPESNIQFGEGGAGTFSDGKLTSRLNHPLMQQVLETLVRFGAPEEILWKSKPHVCSDRLRALLINFRK